MSDRPSKPRAPGALFSDGLLRLTADGFSFAEHSPDHLRFDDPLPFPYSGGDFAEPADVAARLSVCEGIIRHTTLAGIGLSLLGGDSLDDVLQKHQHRIGVPSSDVHRDLLLWSLDGARSLLARTGWDIPAAKQMITDAVKAEETRQALAAEQYVYNARPHPSRLSPST